MIIAHTIEKKENAFTIHSAMKTWKYTIVINS